MSETKNKEYYESLDKRTKEFKEWKAKFDSSPEGLGDIIEKVTEKTGIKKVVKKVFGDDCGCNERRAAFNRKVNFRAKKCLTEKQFNAWTDFRNRENKNQVTVEQQQLMSDILLDIFNISVKFNCKSGCGGIIKGWITKIDKFYETYL